MVHCHYAIRANTNASGHYSIGIAHENGEVTKDPTFLSRYTPSEIFECDLRFEYDPDATAPTFQKFLDEVQPDIGVQHVLCEFFASAFAKTMRLKLDKAFILFDARGNSRGVIHDVMRAMFGKNNFSKHALHLITRDSSRYRGKISRKLKNYTRGTIRNIWNVQDID